jgi:uncharacterized membrane protein
MRKDLTIFTLMGICYVFIEIAFSSIVSLKPALIGQSSLWMFLVGGLLGLTLGKMNEIKTTRNLMYPFNILAGAAMITLNELISGIILNIWLGFDIWDYSSVTYNFLGQIDLVHSLCWIALTPFVFWVDDVMKHYMFEEPKPDKLFKYYIKNENRKK